VIKEIREQPVSKEDVSKVSTAELRAHEVNIKTNEYWLGALMSNHRREEPTSALTKYWSLHAQLTPEVIHKAARRYLQTEPNIQITLLPQESTSKSATTDQ
jgi:zinc protease